MLCTVSCLEFDNKDCGQQLFFSEGLVLSMSPVLSFVVRQQGVPTLAASKEEWLELEDQEPRWSPRAPRAWRGI